MINLIMNKSNGTSVYNTKIEKQTQNGILRKNPFFIQEDAER